MVPVIGRHSGSTSGLGVKTVLTASPHKGRPRGIDTAHKYGISFVGPSYYINTANGRRPNPCFYRKACAVRIVYGGKTPVIVNAVKIHSLPDNAGGCLRAA